MLCLGFVLTEIFPDGTVAAIPASILLRKTLAPTDYSPCLQINEAPQ